MSKRNTGPLRKNPEGGNDYKGTRSLTDAQIRAVEGEGEDGHSFELSFSSEEPYGRWFGLEILDHTKSAINLTRLKNIGVVLFNHDADKVIGKVKKVWIEDNRGKAVIEFDRDDEAEIIRQKVESGTLKGVSVGYIVDDYEHVKEGKTSLDGRFKGECYIAKKWTPLEISIVSVPADDTVGVGRSLENEICDTETALFERQFFINLNRSKAALKAAPFTT